MAFDLRPKVSEPRADGVWRARSSTWLQADRTALGFCARPWTGTVADLRSAESNITSTNYGRAAKRPGHVPGPQPDRHQRTRPGQPVVARGPEADAISVGSPGHRRTGLLGRFGKPGLPFFPRSGGQPAALCLIVRLPALLRAVASRTSACSNRRARAGLHAFRVRRCGRRRAPRSGRRCARSRRGARSGSSCGPA